MPGKTSKYEVVNVLDRYINMEIGRRMAISGVKERKIEIMKEIADFTGVKWDNINMIKRGINTPSLPVALRIAEFFEVKVEDIFTIK